jgi:hypothetical protein
VLPTFREGFSPTHGNLVGGLVVDEHTFHCVVSTGQLFQFTLDPRRGEKRREREADPQLAANYHIRAEVQRMFEGAKAKNVPAYARYQLDVFDGAIGHVPGMVLWSPKKLEIGLVEEARTSAFAYICIPFTQTLVAIDGETQLAARRDAAAQNERFLQSPVMLTICHGRDQRWAQQTFFDLNVLGVKPSASRSISMDTRDELTSIARDVELHVPFFKGRINKVRRQLRATDTDIMTMAGLRVACVGFSEGIQKVRLGMKPLDMKPDRVAAVRDAAIAWFVALTEALGPQIESRDEFICGSPSVFAALGAVGHELLRLEEGQRPRRTRDLVTVLQEIDWRKGDAWVGVAGKMNAKSRFLVDGSKSVSATIFDALMNPSSPYHQKVRRRSAA